MVVLSEYNENVYNLVRPPSPPEIKPPRHETHLSRLVRIEDKDAALGCRGQHQTMGEARTKPPDPDQYLKKHVGEFRHIRQRAKSARGHRDPVRAQCDEHRRPPVPRVTDHVATPLRHRRNFVARNAIDAMCAKGRSNNNGDDSDDDQRFVDSADGHTQNLAKSGMKPVFSRQKSFGRLPKYIERLRAARAEEEARWEAAQSAERERRERSRVSSDARAAILAGLRANWSEAHRQYQGLSLLTDTVNKRLRRERLEARLDALERYVGLIERHTVIVVADDGYGYRY